MSDRTLRVNILGDTSHFDASMARVSSQMQGVGDRMTAIGQDLTTKITLPLAMIGTGAIAAATQIEGAMATIRAGTGATGKELEALGDDFKAVFARVPENAAQVGTAIADLNTRLGLSGQPLRELAEGMLDLAGLAKVEVGPLIAQTTRVFGDWGVATANQTKTLDLLWKVSQTTGIGVDRLSAKLVMYGAPLRAMNFTIKESAALMGKWEREGVNTELVLGSLRIAMGQFAKDGVPMREGLNQTIAEIQRLGPSAEATALAMEIFGARAGPDMAAAILEGRFEIESLMKQIAASPETIAQADAATETFAEKMAILRNQVTLAVEPLGKQLMTALINLMPYFKKLTAKLTGVVQWFGSLPESVQGTIVVSIALAAALGPVLMILGQIIPAVTGVIAVFAKAMPVLIAVKAMFLAITAPIGLVIAAVAALTAGVYLLIKNWDTVAPFFSNLWKTVLNIFSGAVDSVLQAVRGLWAAVTQTFSRAVGSVLQVVQNLWVGTEQKFRNLITGITRIISGVTDVIVAPFRRAQEALNGITTRIGRYLQRINPLARHSRSLVDSVRVGMDAIVAIFGSGESRIGGITNRTKTIFDTAANAFNRGNVDSFRVGMDAIVAIFSSGEGRIGGIFNRITGAASAVAGRIGALGGGKVAEAIGGIANRFGGLTSAVGAAAGALGGPIAAVAAVGGAIFGRRRRRRRRRREREQAAEGERQTRTKEAVGNINRLHETLVNSLRRKYELDRDNALRAIDEQFAARRGAVEGQLALLDETARHEDFHAGRAEKISKLTMLQREANYETDARRRAAIMTEIIKIEKGLTEGQRKFDRNMQRQSLQDQLTNLREEEKNTKAWATKAWEGKLNKTKLASKAEQMIIRGNQAEIMGLLAAHGDGWGNIGKTFGQRLVEGLRPLGTELNSMISGALAGARAIAPGMIGRLGQVAVTAVMPTTVAPTPAFLGGGVRPGGQHMGGGPLFIIQNMHVRQESDIHKISRELHHQIQAQTRARGQ